jgi:signal transduction histidine kinase
MVELAVFNSGSFIAAEELPRVFDRFFRVDRARTGTSGSGLGLAIAKDLVELHHGRVSAASDSQGTTFTISLPVVVQPAPRPAVPPVASSEPRPL